MSSFYFISFYFGGNTNITITIVTFMGNSKWNVQTIDCCMDIIVSAIPKCDQCSMDWNRIICFLKAHLHTIQKKCHRFLLLFNYGRCMQGSIHSFFLMCDMLHTLSSMFASMESKCLLPTVQHLVCICISVLSRRMWPLRSSGIIPSKLTRQERLQCKHCQHSVTSFPDW